MSNLARIIDMIRPGFWSFDPVELVNQSRRLKSRPSNKTLTQSWLIKS